MEVPLSLSSGAGQLPLSNIRRYLLGGAAIIEGMGDENYATWAEDAKVLARIGQHLFGQPTQVTVRLPRDLADQALARWQRPSDEGPLPPETAEQRAVRHKAATLGLMGLSI